MRDYHEILGTSNSSDISEINKAYRKLALKHHPNKSTTAESKKIFNEIAEAYDVLCNPQTRIVYEQFGVKGLVAGVARHENYEGFEGKYRLDKTPLQLFERFFGGVNAFTDFYGVEYVQDDEIIHKMADNPTSQKLVHELQVTLNDLYCGCSHNVKLDVNGARETLKVKVGKGWKNGTIITQNTTENTSIKVDVILKQLEHPIFTREQNDLIYKSQVTLIDALLGTKIELKTIDGRLLRIPITEVICPGYKKIIRGEGMPDPTTTVKGDLILDFDVNFPTYLNPAQRIHLKQALLQ